MRVVPESVWNLWNGLEMRMLVLSSLALQILLIFVAVFRKRIPSIFLSLLLWASYLGADYVATLAIGNLLSKQTQDKGQGVKGDLVSFWAPFLLLHLGGPDAITSYSLEDNELWLRHLLGLLVQVATAALAFLSSLPNPGLWQPAVAVFFSGCCKYLERTLSLRGASLDELRESMVTDPDPGPNYVKFMQEYRSRQEAGLEAKIVIEREHQPRKALSDINQEKIKDPTEVLLDAYRFFTIFKRLMVDLMLSFQDRIDSQEFFFQREAAQAFQVVEIELSLLYDILHTKAALFFPSSKTASKFALVMRFVTLCATLSALFLFHYIRHHSFKKADVVATYVLLVAAVALEAISVVNLLLSDWMVIQFAQSSSKLIRSCARYVWTAANGCLPEGKRWWSNSMRQYNLIVVCLSEHKVSNVKSLIKLLKLKELWDKLFHVQRRDVPHCLKEFVFEELKKKAKSAGRSEDYKQLRACRGGWVLEQQHYTQFEWSIKDREYDESIVMWHIATDLLLQELTTNGVGKNTAVDRNTDVEKHAGADVNTGAVDKNAGAHQNTDINENSGVDKNAGADQNTGVNKNAGAVDKNAGAHQNTDINENSGVDKNAGADQNTGVNKNAGVDDSAEICKLISNYMVFLLVWQPTMLPAGIGKIRFQDTCAEAKKLFSNRETTPTVKEACEMILNVNADIEPRQVKGDRSKSVLFDACRLAKQLRNNLVTESERWELISAVWVELMGYAAGSCRAFNHAKQLSAGGELLTHVWLMMAHMGIGEQYRIESGHARAKLLVRK